MLLFGGLKGFERLSKALVSLGYTLPNGTNLTSPNLTLPNSTQPIGEAPPIVDVDEDEDEEEIEEEIGNRTSKSAIV